MALVAASASPASARNGAAPFAGFFSASATRRSARHTVASEEATPKASSAQGASAHTALAAHDAASLVTRHASSTLSSSSASIASGVGRSSAATSAENASRATTGVVIFVETAAKWQAAATTTWGDAAAATAGNACFRKNCRVADSFALWLADVNAPITRSKPKYADSPSAASAMGATCAIVTPDAAAALPTFSTFPLGAFDKSTSITSRAASSPRVGLEFSLSSSTSSPSCVIFFSFFCFFAGFCLTASVDSNDTTARCSKKSSAAFRAVTPPASPPSKHSSIESPSHRASPHAFARAYSSGSLKSPSRSSAVNETCGRTQSRTNNASNTLREDSRALSSLAPTRSGTSASLVDLRSSAARSSANAAAVTCGGGVLDPGAMDAMLFAACTSFVTDTASRTSACLVSKDAPSFSPRFTAIQHSGERTFLLNTHDAHTFSTLLTICGNSFASAHGMCALVKRNRILNATLKVCEVSLDGSPVAPASSSSSLTSRGTISAAHSRSAQGCAFSIATVGSLKYWKGADATYVASSNPG
mmetsp:Transcript_1380/g.5241  ORF Transcript_1380/g.5241 Transcript_1380/m.5241 type:complete len:534 (+) Transcript_1380:1517-3118(+)